MSHGLFAALALVALSPEARAGETVVRLRVEPMAEPEPALRYQLLPEVRELTPGNAAQDYLKCFMEQRIFFFSKPGIDERARYLAMPLAELAAAKVGGYGGNALRQADRAARRTAVDWQTVPHVQEGGLETPPAELGPLEVLAQALNVRLRAQVAERHYDDAAATAKTMFALGRHLGEYPSGLASEVGLSIVHLCIGTLEEMLQQPACPNLYWALTDLPRPLVDLRKGVQGDRTGVAADLRSIREDAPMTAAALEACVGHLSGVIGLAREQAGRPPRTVRTGLTTRANDLEQVAGARRRLIDAGTAAELVARLPPLQAILLAEKLAFEIERDARIKLLSLPPWQLDSTTCRDAHEGDGPGAFDELLPDVDALRRKQAALEQEIALLRHVEALRLHAAGHSGRLPATLNEVAMPLPDDPFTGKPFEYKVEGATGHLRGSAHRFEVTLGK